MFLPIVDLLQTMLRRSQKSVRGAQRLHRMGRQQLELTQTREHRQETPVPERGRSSTPHHLKRLCGELDFPDPPGAVLHAVLHALAGDLLFHHRLQRAQRLQRPEVDVAPVHEWTQPLQQLRRQHHVAADRAGSNERIAFPVATVGLVVLLERIEAEHQGALGSEWTQPHVDAIDESVRGRLAQHLHQLARELQEESVVVDAAPSSLGLSVLGEREDEIDVGGEVQLARAELAQRQNDELLGLSGVSDRGPEVGALPFVEPVDARRDDRVGQIGGVAHRLFQIGEASDVAPCNPHHLAPPKPPEGHHQAIDGIGFPGHRLSPLAQRRPSAGPGGGDRVRRLEIPARDEIRKQRRVSLTVREDEVGAGEHPGRFAGECAGVERLVARFERSEPFAGDRRKGGWQRRISSPFQVGSAHQVALRRVVPEHTGRRSGPAGSLRRGRDAMVLVLRMRRRRDRTRRMPTAQVEPGHDSTRFGCRYRAVRVDVIPRRPVRP